jgi:phenylacetate-CoA ligase
MYAAIEVGRIGVECAQHRGLHVEADSVIVEILDDGQVAVTSLDSFVMPVIRYRLGDLSAWVDGTCPCGCTFPLMQAPQGRDADMVRLPSGRMVSCAALDYALRGANWVEQYRFIQHSPSRIEVLLCAREHPGEGALGDLRRRLVACLDEAVDFDIRIVDQIPPGGAKFKVFVSRLSCPA